VDIHPDKKLSITFPFRAERVPGFFVLTLFSALIFICGCWSTDTTPDIAVQPEPVIEKPSISSPTAVVATGSVFEQFHFKEVHTDFQRSYLNLIQNINSFNTPQVDIKTQKALFSEYGRTHRKYQDVLKKIASYAEDQKLRCFSIMKSMILAVLYYDKKTNKKMFKFDPDKLRSEKILIDIPKCPDGGIYSIVYKDGRRLFRCSLHGILRQN